RVIYCFLIPQN
ncbi:tcdB toxin N-terminal helical domain protein, partial [Chlamydia psittaci 08DC60]